MKSKIVFVIILLLWITFSGGWIQSKGNKDIIEGNRLYENGDYEEAFISYNKALVNSPEGPLIRFNTGVAAYKREDYEEASRLFEGILNNQDITFKASVYYNMGNALYKQGEPFEDSDTAMALSYYQEAIESYKEAIRYDPKDMDAKYNYEFLYNKIKELEEESSEDTSEGDDSTEDGEDSEDTSEQDNANDTNNGNGGDPSEDYMTLEEAEMLLDSAQGEEVFIVPSEFQKGFNSYVEKDW